MRSHEVLAFGGLTRMDDAAITVRRAQIEAGYRIHSCFDYDRSLDVIARAATGAGRGLRLITKVYFDYPNSRNSRYRPVLNQADAIRERLGFTPEDWILQICCRVPVRECRAPEFTTFIREAQSRLGVTRFLFETFPAWETNSDRILDWILGEGHQEHFGFIFYDNQFLTGASAAFQRRLDRSALPHMTIAPLKGDGKSTVSDIDQRLGRVLHHKKRSGFLGAVTGVSSLQNMKDLENRIARLGASALEDFDFGQREDALDPYGSWHPVAKRWGNPRRVASRIFHSARKLPRRKRWIA